MVKKILLTAAMCVAMVANAQQKYEMGNPNDPNYDYLKEYRALKEYIDRDKYPNFKLGIGTTVPDYLKKSTVYKLTNDNFNETVAGNAMKMSSCVSNSGSMDFTTVKNYVNAATTAGLDVYGHTLAWHSQQPIGWLGSLLQDKIVNDGTSSTAEIASKDFTKERTNGWTSSQSEFGYSISYDATNGMKVHTTKKTTNFWDVQYQAVENVPAAKGSTVKMTITLRGSSNGTMHSKLGDWNGGPFVDFNFTTSWQDVVVEYKDCIGPSFLLLQHGDFVGDIYIKKIKFTTVINGKYQPLTAQERHDTLVYAMDKWIKGMMEACNGKVKAWDVVNEAISGGGDDGQGNYTLQHSAGYNSGTWDVGGDAFYWQDHMGDLEYVRQAVRLARKYGPSDVKLFINDYNLESDWDSNKKLKSLINWIKKWEADGVTKIDGIGTQMHISYYENYNTQTSKKNAITNMFKLMAATGKLVRVSEMDMGYVNSSNQNVTTANMTEAQHKKMADFYEWIIKEYLRLIPAAQQWGICQWCPTDSPANSGWRANTPVGIWDLNYYRKHVYAGFAKGLGADPNNPSGIDLTECIEPAHSGIFDLQGKPMAQPVSELPAGLYIINGKKVSIR